MKIFFTYWALCLVLDHKNIIGSIDIIKEIDIRKKWARILSVILLVILELTAPIRLCISICTSKKKKEQQKIIYEKKLKDFKNDLDILS